MATKLSSIIVTYNSSYIIADCLSKLLTSIPVGGSEIILVDNGSKDGTLEIVEGFKENLNVVSLEENIGFAGGVNNGISISRGKYILIINPDLIINYKCVEGMINFLEGRERVGAVGPKLIYPNGQTQSSCRRYPRFRAILTNRIPLLKIIFGNKYLRDYLMEDEVVSHPIQVEWLIGGCMMFSRDALEDAGLFDSKFFLYFEDADWCYRAANRGWKVFYLPHFTAVHYYQRESKRGINRQLMWHIMSLIRFYNKHGFYF